MSWKRRKQRNICCNIFCGEYYSHYSLYNQELVFTVQDNLFTNLATILPALTISSSVHKEFDWQIFLVTTYFLVL